MRRGVATEDVLNLETNFLALEMTVAKTGSLCVDSVWGSLPSLVGLIRNLSKIAMTNCSLWEKHDSLFRYCSSVSPSFLGNMVLRDYDACRSN
jgi:hypothetical protein